MEIAYLCRMRRSEVLDLRVKDIEDAGFNTRRLKGKLRIPEMTIVGMSVKGDAFTQGFRKLVKKSGVEWFTFTI